MWSYTRNANQPLYQQIIGLIERNITQGRLLPAEKLPSERQLAKLTHVNRSTVVRALHELTERGILIRKVGSGTFINTEKWGVTTQPRINWLRYVDQGSFACASPFIRRTDALRKQSDPKGIDLASGELPLTLVPQLTIPAYTWQALLAQQQYEDLAGYKPLKETIAKELPITPSALTTSDEILITSGAQQALFLITQCLLRPGDTIAIECPSYFYALPLFQSAGLRIIPLPMDDEGIVIEALSRLHYKFNLKMIFVNPTFQNPTGITMSLARRQALITLCAQLHLAIVEDNSYYQLSFPDTSLPISLKQLDKQNVLSIGSLSKVIGSMTRIGWLIGPAAVIARLAEARQEMDFGLSIFPQVLAHHAMTQPSYLPHILSLRATLAKRCYCLISALKAHLADKIRIIKPEGGLHLWCQLPANINAAKLASCLLEEHIFVMPATIFGSKQQALRLTFTRVDEESANRFAQRLATLC